MIRVHVSLSPRRSTPRRRPIVAMVLGLAALPVLALASPVEPLTTFESGDPIVAADFNANFSALAEAVDDNDARIGALEGMSDGGVPTGAVVFFDTEECPVGWSELVEARGRAVVGMNGSAATLLGTVGEGLEDLEDPIHTHTTDVGAFDSAAASVAHTHGVPAHSTGSGGSHNHRWLDNATTSFNSAGSQLPAPPFPVGPGSGTTIASWGSSDWFTDNDGSHSHSVGALSTGSASNTSHAHSVDPPAAPSTGVSTSEVMPYVQLLACRRD